MDKIKIAYIAKNMLVNGISTVILNYCQNLDKNKFKITIFAGAPIEKQYIEELNKIGVEIKETPIKKKNPIGYYLFLINALKSKDYDIVHIHGNSSTMTPELFIAYAKGIKVRIAHSHNSTCDNKKIHRLLKPLFNRLYTHGFACSNIAGDWMFDKKDYTVIPNGFDTQKYVFDDKTRLKIRNNMKLEDKMVIGHVGRFNDQKNHPFLLDVFEKVACKNEKAVLLLIGTGPNFKKINEMIQHHKYKNRIICFGVSENVSELYNAMDVFVLPSKHEGLGIVLLEAQINGLNCVASDVIPGEVKLDNNSIKMLSLEDSVDIWAKAILEQSPRDRKEFYNSNINNIQKYDIKNNIIDLGNKYIEYVDREKKERF